ncbi:MAG: hypothetical protein ACOCWI_05550, partial [Bacillota bacterium]
MKKTILVILTLALITVFFVGCGSVNVDLLSGGDFEYEDTTALREHWTLRSGAEAESADVFSIADGTLTIDTSSSGWAYVAQEAQLRSNAYYKVTYTFNISSMTLYGDSTSFDGLHIGFLEDKDFNIGETDEGVIKPVLHRSETTTDVTEDFYFKTDFVKSSSLAIFVGSEENPVSANVKIRDISLERVKKSQVPMMVDPDSGKEVMTFFELETSIYGAASSKNILFIVLGGVFTLILGYAMFILLRRDISLENQYESKFLTKLRDSKKLPILFVIGFALLIRLLIAGIGSLLAGLSETAYLGFNVEAEATQANFIANYGTVYMNSTLAAYAEKYSMTYAAMESTPMLYYLLSVAGLLTRLFNGSTVLATFFIKLFAIAADIGVIVILYKLLHNRIGKISTMIFGITYASLPLVFSMSGLWGMSESVTVFLIMLTMYFILKNNFWGVALSYFAAFTFSMNAIYMLPIVIFYVINQFINKKNLRLPIILSFVVGFGLFYALNTPFYLLEIQDGSPFIAVTQYFNSLFVDNNFYTMNAFNFQALLGNNFEVITTESLFITILFVVFILGLVAAGYFRNKNRMELLLLGALSIVMMFTFTNRMTPITMYMAIPMMFLYA